MTPEDLNEDRLKFAEELMHEATDDLDGLGLKLDTLKIQSVADDVSYLDSIGRERLANVLATAEIAESTAKADAEEAQAQSAREGEVAHERAETTIKNRENELRKKLAELEGVAKSEEERAQQSALAARSRAEQELQEIPRQARAPPVVGRHRVARRGRAEGVRDARAVRRRPDRRRRRGDGPGPRHDAPGVD